MGLLLLLLLFFLRRMNYGDIKKSGALRVRNSVVGSDFAGDFN